MAAVSKVPQMDAFDFRSFESSQIIVLFPFSKFGLCWQKLHFYKVSFSYNLLPQTHSLSYSPNTALCSLQSFKENPVCYGTGFCHTTRDRGGIQHTNQHFRLSSVTDLLLMETNCDLVYLKAAINLQEPSQVQKSSTYISVTLRP